MFKTVVASLVLAATVPQKSGSSFDSRISAQEARLRALENALCALSGAPCGGPVINSISPTSGPAGTVVTITGSRFLGSVVTFGGLSLSSYSVSASSITATIPAGASTGAFVVSGPGGSATSPTFTVGSGAILGVVAQNATVQAGSQVQLSATVSSSGTIDTSVVWSLSGGANSCATTGARVTSDGLFTGPTEVMTSCTVTVTAVADPSKSDTAIVTITYSTQGPTISGIAAAPSSTTATITWSTVLPSSSRVDLGTDTNYTIGTLSGTSLLTSHSVLLSGLSASTTYHYRVISCGGTPLQCDTSADQTFDTTGVGGVTAVSLAAASVQPGKTTDVGAAASITGGSTSDVYWYTSASADVVPPADPGGDSTNGTISATGLYSAPPGAAAAATFKVWAVSKADALVLDSATITIIAASSTVVGTGGSHTPTDGTITGGGSFPSLVGAISAASCAGLTDGTSCIQTAANSARDANGGAGVPLLFPKGTYNVTTCPTIYTSVIGCPPVGTTCTSAALDPADMPTIKNNSTSTSATTACLFQLTTAYKGGWIYNNHFVGNSDVSHSGEVGHIIRLRGANNVTISHNLMERPRGDCWTDGGFYGTTSQNQNVIASGNTCTDPYRTCWSHTATSDHWAHLDNVCDFRSGWVGPVDLEPGGTTQWGDTTQTDIEIAYNRFESTIPRSCCSTSVGFYESIVSVNGYWDSSPGGNISVHHNYGHWGTPICQEMGRNGTPKGTCGGVVTGWTNVTLSNNVQGDTEP